jgi:uncharacterized protein YkwD
VPAPPAKPLSYWDLEPNTAPNPPREQSPRRRRALHPVAVAVTAVLAVGVASVVGTLAFSRSIARPAAASDTGLTARGGPVQPLLGAGPPAEAPAVGDSPTPSDPATPPAAAGGTPAPPGPSRTAPSPTSKPTGDTGAEAAVLTLVNQERGKAGCQPLAADSRLAVAARLHSQDMAVRGYFDHTTPDGVTFDKRITSAGYKWSNAGENIAKGQKDAASVMQAWMNSPGHRANILNCKFKDIGIGLAYDSRRTPLWTQDFGAQLG